jgi:hypothetical protein
MQTSGISLIFLLPGFALERAARFNESSPFTVPMPSHFKSTLLVFKGFKTVFFGLLDTHPDTLV